MHGGFENETPNIPTNTIMKLDLNAHLKEDTFLMSKLEYLQSNSASTGGPSPKSQGGTRDGKPGDTVTGRAITPPLQSLAKTNMKIRMGKGEIEQKQGQAPQVVNFSGPDGGKGEKINKGVESLHQLFLNHLLRPKTWTGDSDGQSFFAFRREHIMALADEA